MPSKKISQLPGAAPLTGVELLAGLQSGADVAVTPAQLVAHLSAPVTYNTLAAFQAAKPPAGVPVTVRARTGTWPPASGLDATPLTYRPVSSTTGLFGEITVNGQLYAPVYSTNPIRVGEFGAVGDCVYAEAGTNLLTCASNGTSVLTTPSTSGVVVGMNIANASWHSYAAAAIASAGVIPTGTTVLSFVPNTSITVSNNIVTATGIPAICWSEQMTGTDNTAAIQAALDFAMQNNHSAVSMPNGRFMTTDTLNMGWGNTTYELHLSGGIKAPFAGSVGGGAAIYFNAVDRQAISIQGSRGSTIKGLAIIGRGRIFAQYAQGFTNILSSDPLDWLDPRFQPAGNNSGGIQITAPLAGITIDAFSAAQPTIHYPQRTFPSWTGLSANYSSSYVASSEAVLVEDCDLEGFGVLLVSGLVTSNGGDFIKIHRLLCVGFVYGISINNTQSRNVEYRDINYARCHTLFSGTNLGLQSGEIVGPMDNIGGGDAYQTFDFQNMGFCGTIIVANHYFENQVRIGNFVASQAFSAPVIFNGGTMQFQSQNADFNQIPKSYITSGLGGNITMNAVSITGSQRISNLVDGGGALYINGGAWDGGFAMNGSAAQIAGMNYTGGFLFGDARFNTVTRDVVEVKSLYASSFSGVSGSLCSIVLDNECNFRNSSVGVLTRMPMTQCANRYTDTFGRKWRMTIPPEFPTSVGVFSSGPSYSNDQMSFSWPHANQVATFLEQLVVGNLLYHTATKTIFLITVVAGNVGGNHAVTTQQMNNLLIKGDGTFIQNLNPDPTLASGNIIIIKTEAVIPSVLEYGTFSSAGTGVSSISDGSGTSHMASNYVNGDVFFGLTNPATPYRQWPIPMGYTISGVTDGSTGSLTGSANALVSGVFPIFPYELY